MKQNNFLMRTGAIICSGVLLLSMTVYGSDLNTLESWDDDSKEQAWLCYSATDWTTLSSSLILTENGEEGETKVDNAVKTFGANTVPADDPNTADRGKTYSQILKDVLKKSGRRYDTAFTAANYEDLLMCMAYEMHELAGSELVSRVRGTYNKFDACNVDNLLYIQTDTTREINSVRESFQTLWYWYVQTEMKYRSKYTVPNLYGTDDDIK